MSEHNPVKEFLEVLSEFSAIKKISDGKKIMYMLPNLLDNIPDLEKIRKLIRIAELCPNSRIAQWRAAQLF